MGEGKRRIRTSRLGRVVDATWGLWSLPSYVCSGDSGGGIFLNPSLRGRCNFPARFGAQGRMSGFDHRGSAESVTRDATCEKATAMLNHS
jgi:hypothetical protein